MLSSQFGLKAETATNGLIAYNKVKRNLTKMCCNLHYNLICMDIRMPVMDGIKATEKILDFHNEMRRTPAFRDRVQDLKIVAMTAYVDMQNVEAALKAGMMKVYNKPVTHEDLEEATAELVENLTPQ